MHSKAENRNFSEMASDSTFRQHLLPKCCPNSSKKHQNELHRKFMSNVCWTQHKEDSNFFNDFSFNEEKSNNNNYNIQF